MSGWFSGKTAGGGSWSCLKSNERSKHLKIASAALLADATQRCISESDSKASSRWCSETKIEIMNRFAVVKKFSAIPLLPSEDFSSLGFRISDSRIRAPRRIITLVDFICRSASAEGATAAAAAVAAAAAAAAAAATAAAAAI